jgi:hypothetical protein
VRCYPNGQLGVKIGGFCALISNIHTTNKMKKLVFLSLIALFTTQTSHAQQAWTSPKGKFYSQIGYTYLVYDGYNIAKQFDAEPLNRRVAHNTLQGYLQYGLTDKLMLTFVAPFNFTSSTKSDSVTQPAGLKDGKLNGLSNLQLGLTYRFYEKDGIVVSTKVNTVLPTATQRAETGLRTGDDSFGVGPSILAGFGHKKYFTSVELGYLYRTNNYSGQIVGGFQIGKFLGKKKNFLTILHADLRLSDKKGTYNDGNTRYTATYLNNLGYIAYGLKLGYKFTPKIMAWTDIRFWSTNTVDIGARTNDLGLFPGLTFSVSYQN